jgi:hypothetical protein
MDGNPELKNEMRLSIRSLYKLLGLIEEDLKVDENESAGGFTKSSCGLSLVSYRRIM